MKQFTGKGLLFLLLWAQVWGLFGKKEEEVKVDRVKVLKARNENILKNNAEVMKDLSKVHSRLNNVKNDISNLQTETIPEIDRMIVKMYMEMGAGKPMGPTTLRTKAPKPVAQAQSEPVLETQPEVEETTAAPQEEEVVT